MSIISVNCLCGRKFSVELIGGGYIVCDCGRTWVRNFNAKTETFDITLKEEEND
jgi:hypothetical protein